MKGLCESTWDKIRKQSAGTRERVEDDIDGLSCVDFYNYLLDNYRAVNGYSTTATIRLGIGNHTIVIGVYENRNKMMGGIELRFEYNEAYFVEVLGDTIGITLGPDSVKSDLRSVPERLVKELGNIAEVKQHGDTIDPTSAYVIRPKDKRATNRFCCRVLDLILDQMYDAVRYKTRLKRIK